MRTCDYLRCNRQSTIETVLGNNFCYGHNIVGTANKATYGEYAIDREEHERLIAPAIEWFADNPNPE